MPKPTLLRSLRKYWNDRTKNQVANGSESRGSIAVIRKTVQTSSTCTSPKKLEIKTLILGTSESGKTTLLKDMRLFTGASYDHEELVSFAEINYTNIVESIRVILKAMEQLETPLQFKKNQHHIQNIFMQAAWKGYSVDAAKAVMELWADAGVQEAFKRRHEYQLPDNVAYFANHIQRITAAGYIPSHEDILRSKAKTAGITETSIQLDDKIYRVFDVCGGRTQRKKWIHNFWHVEKIVFTVDASAYCKTLVEDESANHMEEQLLLWRSIANSGWFIKTNFVLVFTNVDSLPETIELSPITEYFPDFQGPVKDCGMAQLIDSYLAFLKQMFISLMEQEEAHQRTQVIFADLVQINDQNPASLVLESLKAQLVAQYENLVKPP